MTRAVCPRCRATYERGRGCPCSPPRRSQPYSSGRKPKYQGKWRAYSEKIRRAHVQRGGWVCPGYRRDAHPSTDLTVDHDLGVLCRACNAHKANTEDRNR